ncbi:ester cyclase [Albidovulum sediminicola]|uniref:Ester cyclase n=1 Tax=Albidovulum sediminicola TaxID=2984331 RepID=A0ABT2Z5P1_9RHOB|nr:ester cyclase [Defluviimonas sp. WL0075]MCV2866417.1 ester cyclase [Defluviimonas sp. WL0075]
MTKAAIDVVTQFYETVFQTGDISATEHFMSEDFLDHAPWPGHPATREGFRAGTAEMKVAFPDLAIKPLRVFEEDGKVAAVVRISGTHHGEFLGESPTGRAFEVDGVDILRVEDGKLREHWGVIDSGQMLAQLRLSPSV